MCLGLETKVENTSLSASFRPAIVPLRVHPHPPGSSMFRTLHVVLLSASVAVAQNSPPVKAPVPTAVADGTAQSLSDQFQKLLLANLPDPLVQSNHHWGEQKEVAIGVRWEKKGVIRYRPEVMKDVKNDGHWERVTVTAVDPEKKLKLMVANPRAPEAGKTLLDAVVQTDVRLKYEQQRWAMGKRFYSGETRATCTAAVTMVVELTSRNEYPTGSVLPTLVLRVRVTEAKLTYWDLECEHTLGMGGDAAKVLGKAVHEVMKKVKPDMEEGLLEKANAAVVKAADTKEVKVELGNLLSGKLPVKK